MSTSQEELKLDDSATTLTGLVYNIITVPH